MVFGSLIARVPAGDWKPAGYTPPTHSHGLITTENVTVDCAWRTPQFWLLWVVLCFNVTAGIGILEQASPMIQEMFPGKVTAAAAGGFVALLSLFNMAGRFVWASTSDFTGRKFILRRLPAVRSRALLPDSHFPVIWAAHYSSSRCASVILSMYGGGFATIPAYLKDLFGSMQVGAIHGRLLTAWSVAGVLGPVLVNYIREYLKGRGASGVGLYAPTMYLMAGIARHRIDLQSFRASGERALLLFTDKIENRKRDIMADRNPIRRKRAQTFHLLARRWHSTGVGNLEHAPEIAGAF